MTTKNNTKKEQWDPRTAFDPTKAFDPTTVIDLKKLFDPKTVYTTQSGTALHPRLTDPSSPFKKGGEYSAQLYFPPDVEAVVLERLKALADLAHRLNCKENFTAELKRAPFPCSENKDGKHVFRFKLTASGVNDDGTSWERHPRIFDTTAYEAETTEERQSLRIGSGSEMAISFWIKRWYTAALGSGISLRLVAAQIVRYVDWK